MTTRFPQHTLHELARLLALRTRQSVLSALAGDVLSRQFGTGLDFAELRDYRPGDDARHIHWPSAARRLVPAVRQFQEENRPNDVIALDVSASMNTDDATWTLTAETASMLAAISLSCASGTTLLRFTDHAERPVTIPSGPEALELAARLILEPPPPHAGTAITSVLTGLSNTLHKPVRLFIVSDLLGPLDGLGTILRRLAAVHDVTVCQICHDPARELPADGDVRDAETRAVIHSSPAFAQETAHRWADFLDSSHALVLGTGARYIRFDTDNPPVLTFKKALAAL